MKRKDKVTGQKEVPNKTIPDVVRFAAKARKPKVERPNETLPPKSVPLSS